MIRLVAIPNNKKEEGSKQPDYHLKVAQDGVEGLLDLCGLWFSPKGNKVLSGQIKVDERNAEARHVLGLVAITGANQAGAPPPGDDDLPF